MPGIVTRVGSAEIAERGVLLRRCPARSLGAVTLEGTTTNLFQPTLRFRGGQFTVPGVAKLIVQKRRARKGRNPVTGQPFVIPPRQVVGARISGKIRKAIERPSERARSEKWRTRNVRAVTLPPQLWKRPAKGFARLRKLTALTAAVSSPSCDSQGARLRDTFCRRSGRGVATTASATNR